MKHLIIRAQKEVYDLKEVRGMTVEQLIEHLSKFDPNAVVAVSFDGGYMYGGLDETFYWDGEYDTFVQVNR